MIRSLARSRRAVLLFVVAASVLVVSSPAHAAGGTVRRVTDGTVEATFVVQSPSGANDRVITRYGIRPPGNPNGLFISEFDPNSIICGARTFQGQNDPNTTSTSGSFLDLRPEDPGNPGNPDLLISASPPVFFADGTNNGTTPRICQPVLGVVDWTFRAGAGVPNTMLSGQGFFLTYRFFPQGQFGTDQCSIGIDTDSGVTGRCRKFNGSAFSDLDSDAFLEAVVFEQRMLDLSIRFHGSTRFPGDLGSPIVAVRTRGTRTILPTTDKPSTTIKVDNTTMPPLAPHVVHFRIDADLTGITGGGALRNVTHRFRTSTGQPLDISQGFVVPTGRLVIQAAIPGIPDRFVGLTPVNLPMFATMSTDNGPRSDMEVGVLGLRPNPGTHDDNRLDAHVRPRVATQPGDALAVRFRAYDFWTAGAFRISGVELVGRQTGGTGLDAIQVRKQDAILANTPDLSPQGLLGSIGTLNGLGEIPVTNGVVNRFNLVPDISFPSPPGIQDDIWLIAYFAQESMAGVEIGSDRTFATLLGDSFFSLGNAEPFQSSPQNNYQLRFLLDGEFGTIAPVPAPHATPNPPSLYADHLRLYIGTPFDR